MSRNCWSVAFWGLATALLMFAGCSRDQIANHVAAANDSNIKRLANLYAEYQLQNEWIGPKDDAALKSFIRQAIRPRALEMMNIDLNNLDALFISERDGKPFKIRYNLVSGIRASPVAVVFEQAGSGGKKQVAFTDGRVEEVDDARFQQLWSEKPASPTASGPPSR